MKYFIDTEFIEGSQKIRLPFTNISIGKTKLTIDLISIGIVAEDGREYYAISKDFNLKEAWNRWQQRTGEGDRNNIEPRLYWIRDNVLKSIYKELLKKENESNVKGNYMFGFNLPIIKYNFTYNNLKKLINKYGKTNKQIAEELKHIVSVQNEKHTGIYPNTYAENVEFYGYYSDYDWVVFCWLFGKMIDLPKGFPMYCIDLKQILDDKVSNMEFKKQLLGRINQKEVEGITYKIVKGSENLQKFLNLVIGEGLANGSYPKQTNEHNALADAKWNYELYNFLKTL